MDEILSETQSSEQTSSVSDESNMSQKSDKARKESLDCCWGSPECTELENALRGSSSLEDKIATFSRLLESSIDNLSAGLEENEDSETTTCRARAIHRQLQLFGFHFTYSSSCIEKLCILLSARSLSLTAVRLLSEAIGMLTLLKDPRISDKLIESGIVGITLERVRQVINSRKERKEDTLDGSDSLDRNITEDRFEEGDRIVSGCLWVLCNVALNKGSHEKFINEGAPRLLSYIILTASITPHIDEESRKVMLESDFVKDLGTKTYCGFPTIERLSLYILSKVCTIDSSLIPLIADKNLFENLINKTPEKDVKNIFGGKYNAHKFLQLLRFLISCLVTADTCKAFADAGGIPWLKMIYCESIAKKPYSPTLVSHIASLAANVLSFGQLVLPTWATSQGNSIYAIVTLLNYDKNIMVQKDTARAVSYMMPYYVERRTVVFGKGFFKAFLRILESKFDNYPLKDVLELYLYTVRSMLLIGIGYNKIYEMVMDKQSIGLIGNVITFSISQSIPPELRELADQVLLGVLGFVNDLFEWLKISSFFNIKELFIKHPVIGLQGITKLLSSANRRVQIAAMKVLIEYSTFCQTREWIDANKIVPEKLLRIKSGDDSILAQCLRYHIVRFTAIATFPYDKTTSSVPIPRMPVTPTKSAGDAKTKSESQEGTGGSLRTNRRGRRRALALQQNADQMMASTQMGVNESTLPELSQLDGATDPDSGKRMGVLTDFVLSERSYVSDLNKVVWLYFKPLYHIHITKVMNRHVKLMNKFMQLFSLLEYIVNYSTAFLNVIENRICENNVRVGDVLKAFSVCFDYYVKYGTILSEFLTEFAESDYKSSIIREYIERIRYDSQAEGVSMKEHLFYPLGRAEVYINLLKNLLLYTKDEDKSIIEEIYQKSLSTIGHIKKASVNDKDDDDDDEEDGDGGVEETTENEKETKREKEETDENIDEGKGGEKGGDESESEKRARKKKRKQHKQKGEETDKDPGDSSKSIENKAIDTLFSGIKGYKYGLELRSLSVCDVESGATVDTYVDNSSKLIIFEDYFLLVQLRVNSYKMISKIHISEALVEDAFTDSIKIRPSSSCDLEYILMFTDTDKKDLIYNILKK